jgi:hypothetical protein
MRYALIYFAIYMRWMIYSKCPKCGKRKTFGMTGQSRTETTPDLEIKDVRRLENIKVYEEFRCTNCNHIEWRVVPLFRRGIKTRR